MKGKEKILIPLGLCNAPTTPCGTCQKIDVEQRVHWQKATKGGALPTQITLTWNQVTYG